MEKITIISGNKIRVIKARDRKDLIHLAAIQAQAMIDMGDAYDERERAFAAKGYSEVPDREDVGDEE